MFLEKKNPSPFFVSTYLIQIRDLLFSAYFFGESQNFPYFGFDQRSIYFLIYDGKFLPFFSRIDGNKLIQYVYI